MSRSGFSSIELITTMTLVAIVGAACALLVQSQARLLRHQAERITTSETLRTARAVLRGDLHDLVAPDVSGVAADSVALRVFRGWGVVCAHTTARVAMRYRGLRAPDATKDSLLLPGEERVLTFSQASSNALSCTLQSDEQLVIIAPSTPLVDGAVVLFFETGTYHLSTDALRYHRPGESRQPITDQLIDTRRSRFFLDADKLGLRVQMRAAGDVAPASLGEAHIRFSNHGP